MSKLPLLSVVQIEYSFAPASFQATSYPVAVCTAPIGVQGPN